MMHFSLSSPSSVISMSSSMQLASDEYFQRLREILTRDCQTFNKVRGWV